MRNFVRARSKRWPKRSKSWLSPIATRKGAQMRNKSSEALYTVITEAFLNSRMLSWPLFIPATMNTKRWFSTRYAPEGRSFVRTRWRQTLQTHLKGRSQGKRQVYEIRLDFAADTSLRQNVQNKLSPRDCLVK